MPSGAQTAHQLECQGQVADEKSAGKLRTALAYRTGASPSGPGSAPGVSGRVSPSIATGPIGVILRRFEPGLRLDGASAGDSPLSGTIRTRTRRSLGLTGNMTGEALSATAARMSTDRFATRRARVLPCDLSYQNGRLISQNFRLKCDLGEISFTGSVDVSQGSTSPSCDRRGIQRRATWTWPWLTCCPMLKLQGNAD